MTGFKLWTFSVRSDRSANRATANDHIRVCSFKILFRVEEVGSGQVGKYFLFALDLKEQVTLTSRGGHRYQLFVIFNSIKNTFRVKKQSYHGVTVGPACSIKY